MAVASFRAGGVRVMEGTGLSTLVLLLGLAPISLGVKSLLGVDILEVQLTSGRDLLGKAVEKPLGEPGVWSGPENMWIRSLMLPE